MKKRLLTPNDFSLPSSTVCLSTLKIPQIQNTQINSADYDDESFSLLLNCLNPKSFTFYPCFSKPKITQQDSFSKSCNTTITNVKTCESRNGGNNQIFPESFLKDSYVAAKENDENDRSQRLLTPENFLTVKECETPVLNIPYVPDIYLKPSNNCSSTSKVQNESTVNEFLPLCCKDSNISKEHSFNKKCHSDDEKSLQKSIQNHDALISSNSSVRRKLTFDSPPKLLLDKKEAEEKLPKFSCSLKLFDNDVNHLIPQIDTESLSSSSKSKKLFPPIGVFWDIENCRVPKGLSATHVVQAIRNRFFDGYREAEFVCVCDTLKENPKILEELNDAQVNVMHVGSIVKNAADDKLLQSMRRFADIHGAGASIMLISGDSDFGTELYDLRYRKKLHVILVHNAHAQDCLKLSAHETVLFSELTQEVPYRSNKKNSYLSKDVIVMNIPPFIDLNLIRRRLLYLASSCGGKSITIIRNTAMIRFNTPEMAAKAKRRIEGEDVFGNIVSCLFGKPSHKKQFKNYLKDPDYHHNTWLIKENQDLEFHSNSIEPYEPKEYYPMDIGTQGLWNKSSGSSGSTNMNDGCSNTWRVQSPSFMTSGHNYAFTSPAFNSSQSSSREDTPPMYVQKSDYQESPYSNAQNSIMSGCKSQVNNGNRTCNRTRFQKNSQQWVDNRSETYNSFQYQADTMQALSNLTLGDTSQERSSSITQMPVELLITNLDQNIDAREMKKILLSWFRELVMVLHVSVFVQSDGYLAAIVTIPSHLDAQYAISQLHRKRIGTKRINISCITQSPQPPELKRSKVVILLKEVPGRKLPLFKFRELYERRYQETIGVSELYNMRDLISVSDNTTGRMVCLNTEFDSLQPFMGDMLQDPDELRYCKIHSKGPDKSVGWAERDHSAILPDVFLTLKEVSNAIRILLKTHSGNIPLASLVECYHTEVGPLEESENGVPLEHLISCLSGVCIVIGPGDFKYVRKSESKCNFDPEDLSRYVSPPLVGHLALFSRELVDLLKTFPHCRMLLSRFIPAYHHHFGRQCRVADYGYTKLADLLASLPHLIQIMGEGNKRTITLSHRVQIKRFSSDLLRVLKGQPSKMITLKAFPEAFEKTIGKPWDVTDYGICDIMDLLREIQETTVVLKNTEDGTLISIPKREQTAEEIERTRLFATEVIELLRHSPECKMQFNRFIPAYHHHFGRQCRLSDYGFSKLIELFEAIPDVLQILGEDEEGERILQLVEKERLRILGDQIFTLVKNSPNQMIGISALAAVFMHYYGYSLKPSNYDCKDFAELIGRLRNHVKIENVEEEEPKVTLVDRSLIEDLWSKTREILWGQKNCSLKLNKFIELFVKKFTSSPDVKVLKKDLQEFLQIQGEGEEEEIKLVPLQIFARDLLILLNEAGGRMLLLNFESFYLNRFEVACRPANLGFPNLTALLQSFSDFVSIKGKRFKRIIVLNKDKVPQLPNLPPSIAKPKNSETTEKQRWNSFSSNSAPPPPTAQTHKTSQSQQYMKTKISSTPPTPPCDQKLYSKEVSGGSRVFMSLTSPPQQTYQSHSSVIYSGSPAAPNGSVVWGQVWSPQYSMMPPLSPAHYVMPTMPINWSNVSSLPLTNQPSLNEGGDMHAGRAPVSIQTLEHFGKGMPPNPNELPFPECLTANGNNSDTFFSIQHNDGQSGNLESRTFSSPSKNFAKKRLAAQFEPNNH